MYNQIKQKIANKLAVILSIAIVFSSFGFPLAPTASAAEPLPAPQNVRVTGVTHKSVTLAWDPVDGVDENSGYQVWYSNGGWAAWTGDSTVIVSGLNSNTTYSFYVTAITAANDRSAVVTATTDAVDPNAKPELPLSPPHNLVISDITQSEIKLSWTGSPGAAGYDMYVNNGWSAGIWNGSNIYTYPVPKSVTGSVYFEVAAQITPSAVSARSNRVTIKWGELSKPADLKIVSATKSSVALGWAPTPGATEYDIYKGNSVIASTYSNQYVATALTEGESYDFKIVAKNKLWQSPASDVITAVPGSHYNIVTYYNSWARNPNERNYSVADVAKDIGTDKLTHINYAFADLCWEESGSRGRVCENPDIPLQDRYVFDGEMVLGDPTEDEINIRDLQALKTANPNLNLMISVGGRSWSKNFSNMANTEVNRRLFANSAVGFLREYGFDGLDIDWEYPVAGGDIDNSRRPEDKQNYTLLMKTVREALDAAGSIDGKYYLLTIASYQGESFVVNADLAASSQYIDFINIMTYDYSGNLNTSGYHNAPLFYDPASANHNNVNSSVAGYLNGGVPNYKLVLGVPFFGNGWTGCEAKGEYVPCAGFAPFGTWENGKFDIYDIEDVYLKDKDYVRYWNESAKVPYLYNQADGTFISYDDTESMMYKASLVKTLDLAGVMSWDITGDRNATLSTQLANDLPIHGVMNTNALAAPQNVVSISKTDTTINVGWDTVVGATGYDVFANKVWQSYTTSTEFDVTNLTPNSENIIEVIAIEKDGARIERVSAMSKPLKEITIQTTGTITGTVQGTSNSPLSGAIVAIGGNNVVTDTQGQFTLNNVAPGSQTVTVSKAGYSNETANVTVTAGQSVNTGTITLTAIQTTGTITGTVQGTGNSPLSGAIVAIGGNNVVTDTQGQFTLNNITPGSQTVTVSKAGYSNETANVTVTAGQSVSAGTITLSEVTTTTPTTPTNSTDSTGPTKPEPPKPPKPVDPMPTGVDVFKSDMVDISKLIAFLASKVQEANQSPASVKLSDTKGHWAEKNIQFFVKIGIVQGYGNGEFRPNTDISRAEFVTLMTLVFDIHLGTASDSSFTDIAGHWGSAAILRLAQAGIIKGYSDSTFQPDQAITREEMVIILARILNLSAISKNSPKGNFSDLFNSFAEVEIKEAAQAGIINGRTDNKFEPKSNATRAEALTIIMNILKLDPELKSLLDSLN